MATGETATELTEREAIDRFVGGTLPERWVRRRSAPASRGVALRGWVVLGNRRQHRAGGMGVLAHQAEFPPPNAIGLGLFLGDTLVGVGWLRRNQDLGIISSLVVDPRYRGREILEVELPIP